MHLRGAIVNLAPRRLNSRDYLKNGKSRGILDKSISLLCFADTEATKGDVEASHKART